MVLSLIGVVTLLFSLGVDAGDVGLEPRMKVGEARDLLGLSRGRGFRPVPEGRNKRLLEVSLVEGGCA